MDKRRETLPPDLRKQPGPTDEQVAGVRLSWGDDYASRCLFFTNRPQVPLRKSNTTPDIRIRRPEDDDKYS